MKISKADSILVTFLMQLGDLVLITPFLTALRRAAPQAKITLLMDVKWLEIMASNPDIDEILPLDRKGKDNSLAALWKYRRKLQKRKFDLAINLNPSERCSFLAAFSGAKFKTGATKSLFAPFYDRRLRLNRKLHAADMYLDILGQLGVEDLANDGLKVVLTEEYRKQAADFFTAKGIVPEDKLIGFNIGSASATKCWLPDRFAQVADALAADGYKTVFFGSKAELAVVEKAVSLMHTKPVIATGAFGLGGLTAALGRIELLITNDSGPMHLAVSQKTPLVALYGPSKPELYGPYTLDGAAVVKAQPPCENCLDRMKHKCADMRCMNDLTVAQVIEAANKMLAKGKK